MSRCFWIFDMRRILLIDQIYLYGWCCMIDIHCVLSINPLNAELNSIRHLLALVRARHIAHVSRIWVNYIYIYIYIS